MTDRNEQYSDKKNETNYTIYDFDRPDKFSFEHLKSLESIITIFARNFATDLSGYLRIPIEIEVDGIEQIPFGKDYVDKRGRDKYVFCINEFNGEQFIIQFDIGFLLRMHTKLLGGSFGHIEDTKKNITEFEKLTMTHLLETYLYPNLQDAFKNVEELEFHINEIETDSQYARITFPQDMVALVNLTVYIENEKTTIQIVFPYLSIESIIEKLNTDNVLKNKKIDTPEDQLTNIYDSLLQLKHNFVVNLGKKKLKMKELEALEINDVIPLGNIENDLICSIDDKDKFKGRIGQKNGKKAIKITGEVQDDYNQQVKQEKIDKIKDFYENKYQNDDETEGSDV